MPFFNSEHAPIICFEGVGDNGESIIQAIREFLLNHYQQVIDARGVDLPTMTEVLTAICSLNSTLDLEQKFNDLDEKAMFQFRTIVGLSITFPTAIILVDHGPASLLSIYEAVKTYAITEYCNKKITLEQKEQIESSANARLEIIKEWLKEATNILNFFTQATISTIVLNNNLIVDNLATPQMSQAINVGNVRGANQFDNLLTESNLSMIYLDNDGIKKAIETVLSLPIFRHFDWPNN